MISDVLAALGSDSRSIPSVLEFLHVLPEEVTEGRKINLTVRLTLLRILLRNIKVD